MIALFSLDCNYAVSVRIPKKNGIGYLKAALGGHHHTKESSCFNDSLSELGAPERDYCDVDGYLHIAQGWFDTKNERMADAKLVMIALEKTFPRITKWKEVDLKTLFEL